MIVQVKGTKRGRGVAGWKVKAAEMVERGDMDGSYSKKGEDSACSKRGNTLAREKPK